MALLRSRLARPQQGKEEFRIRAEGIAIEMCIDRSGSMQAMDFEIDGEPVSRWTVVKKDFREFVGGEGGLAGRPDDLIGLVDFGGFAEAKCPLDARSRALMQLLDTVKIAAADRRIQGRDHQRAAAAGGSIDGHRRRPGRWRSIGSSDVKAKSKIMILLTDGESNAGVMSPEEAAKIAKTFGIKIYTIGIGTNGTVPFHGRGRLRPTRCSMPMQVRLDEKTLQMIADTTGGQYFNAQDTERSGRFTPRSTSWKKPPPKAADTPISRAFLDVLLSPGLALIAPGSRSCLTLHPISIVAVDELFEHPDNPAVALDSARRGGAA